MTTKSNTPFFGLNADVLETYMAISKMYLAGAERLTVLNLTTARQAVEDCAAASKAALDMTTGKQPDTAQTALGAQTVEKALAYSRTSFEIIAETQQDVSDLLIRQFSGQNAAFAPLSALSENWRTAFEMFTKGIEQISAATSASAPAGAKSASHATTDAMSHARKAA